ncbi:hypothetical protein DYB37_009262 [Aphanomyces astaci]|uniref:tRNA pseudouridine(55) synthase n=1 Tax=Aphanomyces astaci TaxID=112090 RepID=A0A3R6YII5_APHAT|nr:hypothetical protein DYB37_009262 [Aphanomyces astaci]
MADVTVNATLLGLLPAASFEKLHALKGLGVCIRCILRYAAISDHELYSLDTALLNHTWDAFVAAHGGSAVPTGSAGVCTCCLDVFEGALGAAGRADLIAKSKDRSSFFTLYWTIRVLEGERLGESSVEEAIGDIVLPHFQAKSYKFHTAGREDRIQAEVNLKNADRVEIRQFQLTDKKGFTVLQAGADSKRKTYCCVVWVADKLTREHVASLNGISDLAVAQKTPGTVLHIDENVTKARDSY